MNLNLNSDTVTIILLITILVSAIGVIAVGVWLFKQRSQAKVERRLSRYVIPRQGEELLIENRDARIIAERNLGKVRSWVNQTLSNLSSESLQLKLSSAYWPVTDTEFILIRIGATVLGFLLGWLFTRNILGGIFLGGIALMVPPLLLDRAISQRQQKFHNQLLDVLILIKGSVQSGYSLMQALDLAVKEIPAPASEEFGRVIREVRFGISTEVALQNLAERMQSDDMQIVVTAIIINSQVGGNLSVVLESTITTIRDRMHLFGEIRSLTSYARYVGNLLTLLPFLTGLLIFIISPDYFSEVTSSVLVQIIFVIALIGVLIGNIWLRRIVQIKI